MVHQYKLKDVYKRQPQDMEELAAAAVANAEVSDPDPDAGLFPGPYGPSGSGEYDAALHEAQVLDTVKALYASLSQHCLLYTSPLRRQPGRIPQRRDLGQVPGL